MFNEIMLDIETLDNIPTSAIVTVGACAFNFDTGEIGEKFHININPKSCQQAGLSLSADTIMWWMGQSKEAQEALISKNAVTLEQALQKFTEFCCKVRENAPLNRLTIWGNDITFDNVIMENAYRATNQTIPWAFWESGSVRTLVKVGKQFGFDPKKDMPRGGTHHNALDDAIFQAEYCMKIMELITTRA
jgi:hypothetical protein